MSTCVPAARTDSSREGGADGAEQPQQVTGFGFLLHLRQRCPSYRSYLAIRAVPSTLFPANAIPKAQINLGPHHHPSREHRAHSPQRDQIRALARNGAIFSFPLENKYSESRSVLCVPRTAELHGFTAHEISCIKHAAEQMPHLEDKQCDPRGKED